VYGGTGPDRVLYTGAQHGVDVDLVAGTATGEGTDVVKGVEHAVGSAYADHLAGTDGSSILTGLDGDDVLVGRGSGSLRSGRADLLSGGPGADTLDGGAGFDFVDFGRFEPGPVTVDLVQQTATGQGTDTLVGVEGAYGTAGADSFLGTDGQNAFWGGGGDDTIDAGAGPDTALYIQAAGPVRVNLAVGSGRGGGMGTDSLAGIEDVWGSSYGDTLAGDAGPNFLRAGSGDDTVSGGEGDDVLDGGSGTDRLDGGAGSADQCLAGEQLIRCE
jgi:Ca2+-binding RTX toxin-like protein